MGNLFASLDAAAGALQAFRDGIQVSQNNVSNATTPGYAKQRIGFESLPFDLSAGSAGGVSSGALISSRSWFAENAVRQQSSYLGNFAQQAAALSQIEGVFDVGAESGIPASLDRLFNAFAEFSSSPSSIASRQSVVEAARQVAASFNGAALELGHIATQLDGQIEQTVVSINQIAAQIQAYNKRVLEGRADDPGLQALAVADAQSLAELVDVNVLVEANGTMTVLLGGQVPLVIGDRHETIRSEQFIPAGAVNPGARSSVRILDGAGRDITSLVSQGELKGLLHARTQVLPALAGDGMQNGSLNELAQVFADRVNDVLTAGLISTGPPPVPGIALFTYAAGDPTATAKTLTLNPAITAQQLAAASAGPPFVSNGAALELADMRNGGRPEDLVGGLSFLDFYASQARVVGDGLRAARQQESRAHLLLTQANDLRQQLSGVSLDEEAIALTELQRSYEANAQVVKIIDEMIQSVLAMVR